jgi:hypothetical protein
METQVKVEKTFQIREERMEEFQTKIDGLNKKAAKLGVSPVSFKVIKTELIPARNEFGIATGEEYALHHVTIEGATPKLPGWTFSGVVEHTPAGNIIKVVPGQEIDTKYREAKSVCDHCGHDRHRKETFIVRHENGEVKQIGRQCLRDFLGGSSPQRIAEMLQFVVSVMDLGDEDLGSWGGSATPMYSVLNILAQAMVFVKRYGFVSRAAARAYAEKSGETRYITTTADEVLRTYEKPKDKQDKEWLQNHLPTEEDLEDAKKVVEWIKGLAGDSDYEHNLKTLVELGVFKHAKIGIVVSGAGVWAREQGKAKLRESRAKENAASQWVGEVGKRQVFDLTLVDIKNLGDNAWGGCSVLHRFKDTDGNIFTWFASKEAVGEVGQTLKLKATIKKHEDYKGMKQTLISRCTVVERP